MTGCAVATPILGACSMSFPMASMLPVSDDVTASNSTIPFARLLDEEDRRREKAALATALDPQGDGRLMSARSNPDIDNLLTASCIWAGDANFARTSGTARSAVR